MHFSIIMGIIENISQHIKCISDQNVIQRYFHAFFFYRIRRKNNTQNRWSNLLAFVIYIIERMDLFIFFRVHTFLLENWVRTGNTYENEWFRFILSIIISHCIPPRIVCIHCDNFLVFIFHSTTNTHVDFSTVWIPCGQWFRNTKREEKKQISKNQNYGFHLAIGEGMFCRLDAGLLV